MNIPHNNESEMAILGICLYEYRCIETVISRYEEPVELFYDIRNREVWLRLEKLHKEGKPIDVALVGTEKITEEVDLAYFTDILAKQSLPADFLEGYLTIAEDYRKRRMSMQAALKFASQAANPAEPFEKGIAEIEQTLFSVRSLSLGRKTKAEVLQQVINEWEWAHNHPGELTGIGSGFHDLDRLTWGFQKRNLIVFGARPSQGKTAILLNIANHVSLENKVPMLIFSLESSTPELFRRLIIARGRMDQWKLKHGQFTERDFYEISKHQARLLNYPLYVIDDGSLTISQIRALARVMASKHGIQMIGVDYLQKVKPSAKHEKRTYEVGQVSEGLKEMAKELDMPVIVTAQLNRESEKEKGRQPRSSDLGDSGMIERDADIIALLYREKEQPNPEILRYSLLVGKNRDGETRAVPLLFQRKYTQFQSVERGES